MRNTIKAETSSMANQTFMGALGVLGGVWLIISPFVFGYNDSVTGGTGGQNATTLGITCGVITIIWAGFCLMSERREGLLKYRFNAAIGLILMGVWLMAAPYLFNYSEMRNPLYNLQITGAIFILIAGYVFQELYSQYQTRLQSN